MNAHGAMSERLRSPRSEAQEALIAVARTPLVRSLGPGLAAEEGDDAHFCSTCAFGSVCMPHGVDKAALLDLHCLVEHVGPYSAGDRIFRTGDRFGAIYAVRAGTVKTCLVDDEGREQVLGFHLPGEMVGLNAIHPETYPCEAIALESVELCRFSFPALATLATRMPGVQQQLFRLLSRDIGKASILAGDYSADARLAAFLIDLGERTTDGDASPPVLRLSMSRSDIANYLRLAAETVSRVLRRFQDQGLVDVDGRNVAIARPAELRKIARAMLRE